jgi:hypothetical protein
VSWVAAVGHLANGSVHEQRQDVSDVEAEGFCSICSGRLPGRISTVRSACQRSRARTAPSSPRCVSVHWICQESLAGSGRTLVTSTLTVRSCMRRKGLWSLKWSFRNRVAAPAAWAYAESRSCLSAAPSATIERTLRMNSATW